MKCLNCGGMQMLRCEHTGGGIYWLCPRCNSTTESTGGGRMTEVEKKENKELKKLFIFKNGNCVYKNRISVKPITHHYGKDECGCEYYKYSCPICDIVGCNHQITEGEHNCPICGINLDWEWVE